MRPTLVLTLAAALAAGPAPVPAQSVLQRSPNLSGGWVGSDGTLHFNFLHRFDAGDAPARKVTNAPTFLLAYGIGGRALVGVNYATNSQLVPAFPNEWEAFGRFQALSAGAGSPVDAGATLAYNQAAESVDGALSVGLPVSRLRLLGTARAFSDAFGSGESRFAVGGGAVLTLHEWVALAGDVATLLDLEDDEEVAWSAGVQLVVPYTPHTLSLHATNTNTGTLQGSSLGEDLTRWGFEFTIPVTLSRYFGRGEGQEAGEAGVRTAEGADTVVVSMQDLAYRTQELEVTPGTVVTWVNDDPVQHTSTADDGSWDSGLIDPGGSWSRVFTEPGEHPYHCIPHPFMTAVVRVVEGDR